jgi:hypothetical protein
MKYVISSNIKYYCDTYPVVVQSLLDSGVLPEDIIMVVGGCENDTRLDNPLSIQVIPVEYNSFDLTALIYVADKIDTLESSHVFLMHDTCLVGPSFKVESLKYNPDDLIKTLRPGISMNIGLYSAKVLRENRENLNQYKFYPNSNEELQQAKEFFVIHEDIIFKLYPEQCYNNYYVSSNSPTLTLEELSNRFPKEPYLTYISKLSNSNIDRMIGHGVELDFYKLQANYQWGGLWRIGV